MDHHRDVVIEEGTDSGREEVPGHEVSVVRDVAAGPEVVWDLVSDLVGMGRWSPENRGGRWIDGATGPTVGAVFRGRNRIRWRRWQTNVTVIECDRPRRFAFRLKIGSLGGCDWSYDIVPTLDGCRVTESWVDDRSPALARIGWLFTGVADRAAHNRATMERTLENLATAAEAI